MFMTTNQPSACSLSPVCPGVIFLGSNIVSGVLDDDDECETDVPPGVMESIIGLII